MKTHTYKGVLITPAPRNSYGIRWHAFGPLGQIRADTLAAMKDMIRDDFEQVIREESYERAAEKHRAIMNAIWSNSND